MSVVVCRADEIGEGCARGFIVGEARVDIVVVRRSGVLRTYLNSCPHQGTPLETFPDRFLDQSGLLLCSTHGARFRVEDGHCVSGPCVGKSLRAIACAVEDGVVVVDLRGA
ncbi:MAG: Rieske (2Fe-2S) protein [Alphaproteobacteria bacterium]|nr:Rieske (2Fe-2S) protein [Alphaproteobacteria bacterium]